MKRYASVFMLLARSTIWKLLGLFAAMTAVELGLFVWRAGNARGLEQIFETTRMHWVFGGALVLLALILGNTLCESGGRLDYTLRRLRVNDRKLFVCQGLYNTVCFMLLWAVQVFVALLLCRYWVSQQEGVSHQAVFLACYRSDFLHSLLPLEDMTRYVRNLFLFAGLGVCCACHPVRQRRGKQDFGFLVATAVVMFWFPGEMAKPMSDAMWMFLAVLMAFICLVLAWGEEYSNED